LALTPCLRFDANLFSAPPRHYLLLLHTPAFLRIAMNSFRPLRSKGLGDLVWEEAPPATQVANGNPDFWSLTRNTTLQPHLPAFLIEPALH
jgi:hypothetical protein